MKIDYISDLHLDFWLKELNTESPKFKKQLDNFINDIIMAYGGDVIIIAGDLGHYFNQNKEFLLKMKEMYTDVIIVHGNHDLYLVSRKQQEKYKFNSYNRITEMKRFCEEQGINYLDGDVVKINGISFGGAGMSWDKSYLETLLNKEITDEYVLNLFRDHMNDSRLIFNGKSTNFSGYGRKVFNPLWDPIKHFQEELERLKNISNVDIMVSHYSPVIPKDLPLKYSDSQITTFYYFNGKEEVLRIKPKYWFYGHTHQHFNYMQNGVNFLCNPLGYPKENTYGVVQTLNISSV